MIINQKIRVVGIRERQPLAKGLRRAFNNVSREAWRHTGKYFHENLRDKRFTPEHAREAGYFRRKGEGQAIGSKVFKRSYQGKKFYSPNRGGGRNQANPLEDSGETRELVRSAYSIHAVIGRVEVRYPGARKLNYRNPKSRIRMNEEFKRLTDDELVELARVYDDELDRLLKKE